MKMNDVVWGQAIMDFGYVQGKCKHLYASVHFSGRITLIERLDEKRQAAECLTKQLDKDPEKLIADLTDDRLNNAVLGRLDIEYMSGKKSKEVSI
jgi:nitroimidazol reductase NimA-like FMN-containing flavoprotein (pyridoxamine 5'-phosphate oxidase superfamily)